MSKSFGWAWTMALILCGSSRPNNYILIRNGNWEQLTPLHPELAIFILAPIRISTNMIFSRWRLSYSSINLTWTDTSGATPSAGYLIHPCQHSKFRNHFRPLSGSPCWIRQPKADLVASGGRPSD